MAVTGLSAIVVVAALALVPVAFNSSTPNGLFAYVTVTNRGPIPACTDPTGASCTLANQTQAFIHVVNGNRIEPVLGTFKSRATLVNSFVVNSVEFTTLIDGQTNHGFDATFSPPPNASILGWSGHWPSTVTCPVDSNGNFTGPPCAVVGSPAVIPGENTTILYTGWNHVAGEPTGKHVFKFTVHGTLNGESVDLTASSLPIVMT